MFKVKYVEMIELHVNVVSNHFWSRDFEHQKLEHKCCDIATIK